jgi:hypothetical protein
VTVPRPHPNGHFNHDSKFQQYEGTNNNPLDSHQYHNNFFSQVSERWFMSDRQTGRMVFEVSRWSDQIGVVSRREWKLPPIQKPLGGTHWEIFVTKVDSVTPNINCPRFNKRTTQPEAKSLNDKKLDHGENLGQAVRVCIIFHNVTQNMFQILKVTIARQIRSDNTFHYESVLSVNR